jgi:flagellar hook assembly protein FlgD
MTKSEISVYPNPFSTTTAIKLSGYQATKGDKEIGRQGDVETNFSVSPCPRVTLSIYDLSGRLIKTLNTERGRHGEGENVPVSPCPRVPVSVTWDGTDNSGKNVKSGVYFIRLEGDTVITKKIILVR